MSLLGTLARMEAVRDGRAVPLATVRHRHLADRPMLQPPGARRPVPLRNPAAAEAGRTDTTGGPE